MLFYIKLCLMIAGNAIWLQKILFFDSWWISSLLKTKYFCKFDNDGQFLVCQINALSQLTVKTLVNVWSFSTNGRHVTNRVSIVQVFFIKSLNPLYCNLWSGILQAVNILIRWDAISSFLSFNVNENFDKAWLAFSIC